MPQIIRDNFPSNLDKPQATGSPDPVVPLDIDTMPGTEPLDEPDQPIGDDEDVLEIGEPDALDIEEEDPEADNPVDPLKPTDDRRDAFGGTDQVGGDQA